MHSFAVFDDVGPATAWPLRHANITGPDDIAVHGEVSFRDGLIVCEKRSQDAAGLSVQFEVRDPDEPADSADSTLGTVTLRTTLLPARDRPYLLSLELARARLMLILNKLEDWALFDLAPDHPVMVEFEAARCSFTEAVVAVGGEGLTPAADKLARRALWKALACSDRLVTAQSELQLKRRMSGELHEAASRVTTPSNALTDHEAMMSRNALIGNVGVVLPSPPLIGMSIAPQQFSQSLTSLVQESTDFICMPMRWMEMEPTEGRYVFATTDRWIEWAVRHAKLPIVGGPIIDFRPQAVPEWLYIWEHDYETLRELVHEHVKQLVTRYRRTVQTWTVVSGLHVNKNFSLSFEQVLDLTRLCVMLVRKLQPSARVQIEIDQPWGEYAGSNQRSIPPALYAEMINQAGLNIDLLSLRVEMGQPEVGRATHDPLDFSAMLDRFAALERPINISAISAPSAPPDADALGMDGQLDPGYWRRPWGPESQADWMLQMLRVAASKPYIHSVCWSDLYDCDGQPGNVPIGLIDQQGQAKPGLRRFAEIRRAIHERAPMPELAGV